MEKQWVVLVPPSRHADELQCVVFAKDFLIAHDFQL